MFHTWYVLGTGLDWELEKRQGIRKMGRLNEKYIAFMAFPHARALNHSFFASDSTFTSTV